MPHFSCEVNFFCAILHYKRGVIYQQLNIKYLKKTAVCCSLVLCHSMFATSLLHFAFRALHGITYNCSPAQGGCHEMAEGGSAACDVHCKARR